MTASTTLYRLYNAADALLYVGIASNPGRRFEQHRTDKLWWGDVASITLEHHPSREVALEAELAAIRTENPRHNIAGHPGHQPSAPGWEHRPLPNGAYLDTEHRGDHIRVTINRDDLVNELRQAGQPYEVPARVAAAHERAARIACRWLWAAGLAVGEDIPTGAGRWRSISVAAVHVEDAQHALAASELQGDVSGLERLAARLIATFPASDGWPWEESRALLTSGVLAS